MDKKLDELKDYEKLDSLYNEYNKKNWTLNNFREFDSLINTVGKVINKAWKKNDAGKNVYRMGANMALKTVGTDASKFYVKELLSYDPYLLPDSTDNKKLKEVIKLYLPLPRWSVGIRIGGNYTKVDESKLETYSIFEYQGRPDATYKMVGIPGLALSIPIELNTIRYLSIGMEPGFSLNRISYTSEAVSAYDISLDTKYDLNFSFIELPILVRLHVFPLLASSSKLKEKWLRENKKPEYKELNSLFKKNSWYLLAGWKWKYLTSASIDKDYKIDKALDGSNYDAFVGMGVRKYFSAFTLGVEFRYNYGLNKISNPDKRFFQKQQDPSESLSSTEQLLFNSYQVVDQLHLNSFEVSLIYLYGFSYKAYSLK